VCYEKPKTLQQLIYSAVRGTESKEQKHHQITEQMAAIGRFCCWTWRYSWSTLWVTSKRIVPIKNSYLLVILLHYIVAVWRK